MKQLRVGIIGAGNIGGFHARVLQETENAVLAAVADVNEALASKIAGQYGCRSFSGYQEMLSWGELDLVSICLPPSLHYSAALDTAKAGKHILMEKPMDISCARADSMIAECKKRGVKLSVISQHRFDPAIKALRGLIDRKKLGKNLYATVKIIWYREPGYYQGNGSWRGLKSNQGGVLMAQAIHYVDLLQYIMGDAEAVQSVCRTLLHASIEVEDTALVLLRFKDGAIGSIEATTIAYPGLTSELSIYTEKATVRIKDDKLDFYASKDGPIPELEALLAAKNNSSVAVADPMALDSSGHRSQYLDMIDAIRRDREPELNGREGRRSIALIEAIHRASESGGWTSV
jgi:predicted dehydrogenase